MNTNITNHITPVALIDSVWEETNPFFNPDKANNGGGYSQPHIEYRFNDGYKIVVDDGDVGDFGLDLSVVLYDENDKEVAFYRRVEEIDGAGDRVRDEMESTWTFDLLKYANLTAYYVFTKEEAEDYMSSNEEWGAEEEEWEDIYWE